MTNDAHPGDVHLDGFRMHYYRAGVSGQPVVFIHGITDDGLCWLPVVNKLTDQFDLVMVDLRGHGLSDAPEHGYTLLKMAEDIACLISELQLEKPILIGHSLGAAITLAVAGAYPTIPRSILLEDPPPFWSIKNPSPRDAQIRATLPGWMQSIKTKTYSQLLDEARRANTRWSEEELDLWVQAKQRFSIQVSRLAKMQDVVPEQFDEIIRRIICPVVFIPADSKLGGVSTRENVDELKRLVPQLELVQVTAAGHNIRRDCFPEYMRILIRVLNASD